MTPHFFLVLLIPLQVCSEDLRWEAGTGTTTRLECRHRRTPVESVTWELNTTQIVYKDKDQQRILEGYDLELSEGKVYLVIKKVEKNSTGTYTCNVFHVEGTFDRVRGELYVKAFSTVIQSSLAAIVLELLLHMVLVHL